MTRRRRRGQDKLNKLLGEDKPKGLNPIDLITSMSPEHKKVINWLARRRQATSVEIAAGIGWELEKTQTALDSLRREGALRQAHSKGEIFYRVSFGGRTGQITGSLPDDIWARIDVTHHRFLRQVSIFANLDEKTLKEIAEEMALERHQRGDIVVWQGEAVKKVYFIKSGIVGVSIFRDKQKQETQYLSYLQQGQIFGEFSLLAERDVPASANVAALTAIQLLSLPHDRFVALLKKHSSMGLGLAQMLAKRILHRVPRDNGQEAKLVLVFGVGTEQVTVGCSLAAVLAQDATAVYTEYPAPHNLVSQFHLDHSHDKDFYTHPLGFDLAVHNTQPSLPQTVRVTLLLKQLMESYANVVIGLPWRIDDAIAYLLERAKQIVLVSPADETLWPSVKGISEQIQHYAHPEKSALFVVQSGAADLSQQDRYPLAADFPILERGIEVIQEASSLAELPDDLSQTVRALADRLGRTNQVSVFIPTTVDVNQTVDSKLYVEQTLALLGRLFGGATSSEAQGVWNSDEVGLVGETVYIVRSYATKIALDAHLSQILEFVEQLKEELSQEAMAVEVNQKLMLI